MTSVEGARDRDRDLDRYLTFVDAVVAIAITLLVLPLTEVGADLGEDESVAHLLRTHHAELWSFLLSFFVIASLWLAQHRALRSLVAMNGAVTRLLLVWTLAIVVLPFFTELVAEAADDPLTKALYFGSIALACACIAVLETIMRRGPGLCDGTDLPSARTSWVNVGLLVVGALLSIAFPALSYYPLLLLLADNLVLGLGRRAFGR